MNLTEQQRMKVVNFAKSLVEKRTLKEDHPLQALSSDLASFESDLVQKCEDAKDEFVSWLIEIDDTLGTDHPIYARVQKLADILEKCGQKIPGIIKDYETELQSGGYKK